MKKTIKTINTSQPAIARRQHIAVVEAELKRLTVAVKELKANTADATDWDWVGDWQHFGSELEPLVNDIERAVVNSRA